MKPGWKIISVFCIVLLLFVASLCGTLLYYSARPSSLKSLIEKSISRATGTSVTIQAIDYTLHPMSVRAEGILFGPGKDLKGFHLEISHVSAEFVFEGPFGKKNLIVRNLKIHGFAFQMTEEMRLPENDHTLKPLSFINKIIRRTISLFLFRDVMFQSAEIDNGKVEAKTGDQVFLASNIRGSLDRENLVEISCSAEMQWPSRSMRFNGPEVHFFTNHVVSLVDPEIKCHLFVRKASFLTHSVEANGIDLEANLHYAHSKRRISMEHVDLFIDGVSLIQENIEAVPLHMIVNTGFLDLLNKELDAPHLNLKLKEIAELNGGMNVRFGDSSRVSLEIGDSHFSTEKLMPFLGGKVKEQLAPISLSGPVSFKGEISGRRIQETWAWQCDIKNRLDQNPFKYTKGSTQLKGSLSGGIDLKGEYPDGEISAKMQINATHVTDGNIHLPSSYLTLNLSGKQPLFKIEDLSAEVPLAEFHAGGKNIVVTEIRLNLQKGKMDIEEGMILFPEIRMDSTVLKNMVFFLSLDKGHLLVKLKAKKANLMESAVTLGLLPGDWQIGSLDAIEMKISRAKKGILSVASHVELEDLRFQNPDSSCVGENLSINTEISGEIDLLNDSIGLHAELQVKKGEVLYDRFYLNLTENGFIAISDNMQYDISKASLQIPDLTLALNNILEVKMNGSLIHSRGKQHLQCSLNLPGTDLKPIYRHFVLEPFQMETPSLKTLDLAGMISAELEFTGKGPDIMAIGYLHWNQGKLSMGEGGLALQGVHLDFPIWYQTEKLKRNREPLKGNVTVDTISVPSLLNQSLTVDLEADHEKLLVRSPTVFKIPGGVIKVGPISAKNMFSSKRSVETTLTLENFDIEPLLSKIWSKSVKGAINGKLEPLFLEGSTLTSTGNISVSVFDGKVTLADLGATGIFTAAPVLKSDAYIEDLSLAGITSGTPFGKIEGILKGYVKNLEIAYGQPQRFNLLLETHEKKGVSQKVSLEAVDNIARIGGTQSPFMGLTGRLASFFDEFSYKKIGLRASLNNDVFRINGTIEEKGTEYIMKRGGFSGVSIVNHDPDNQVSFKDMMKRIKRIQSGKRKNENN
jgi:hypothetical protein